MNRASTRCPASTRSAADTAESTPPESATTTRAIVLARDRARHEAGERHLRDHVERIARPAHEIVDAELDEGTAVLGGAYGQFAPVEPQRPEDRAVELRAR